MNQQILYKSLLAVLLPLITSPALADKQAMAEFFGRDAADIHMECPQKTYEFGTDEEGDKTLRMCLHREDKKKRCEVTVKAFTAKQIEARVTQRIAFDIKRLQPTTPHHYWHSVFQIHNHPDVKEEWRCPVSALEVDGVFFRMFNRWDEHALSVTDGDHCTGEKSTLQSRSVFNLLPAQLNQWHPFEIKANFTHDAAASPPGVLQIRHDGTILSTVVGPNRFNDKKPPYIKFGIYKPTHWKAGDESICVEYRRPTVTSITQDAAVD